MDLNMCFAMAQIHFDKIQFQVKFYVANDEKWL